MCGDNLDDDLSDGTFDILVVGTVSLMTTWAAMPDRDPGEREQRDLVASKIAMNLYRMLTHRHAKGPMACSLAHSRQSWLQLLSDATQPSADPKGKSAMH
jgi:hypothetical protein